MLEKILIFVLFLGPLVFFHELGHFFFARLFGVRVEVFSIGFGPKLLKWKWGDTEYALSLIPLGGYVKMFGDDPLNKDAVPEDERKFSFTHKSKWARFWIVMGGPLANFVMAFVIFFLLLVGGEKVPQIKMGRLESNSVLYERGLRSGDIVVKVNGEGVASPSDIALEGGDGIKTITVARAEKELQFKINMAGEEFFEEFAKYPPYFRKPVVVDQKGEVVGLMLSGKSPDMTLSLDDLESNLPADISFFNLKKEDDQYEVADEPVITAYGTINNLEEFYSKGFRAIDLSVDKTAPDSAADKAGMQPGDVIFSLDGSDVFAFEDLRRTLQESKDETAQIGLWRKGEVIDLKLQPEVSELEGQMVKLIGVYSGGEYVAPTYVTSTPKGFFTSIIGAADRT